MDQDDSMMSTPSSPPDDPEDSQIQQGQSQSQVRALTPQNDHLNASAPGELSPPRSQPQTQTQTQTQSQLTLSRSRLQFDNDDEGLGDEMSGGNNNNNSTDGAPGTGEWRAGMWKSKKDQDEMQKVWDSNYVDRDFSLSVFGDVLEHKIPGDRRG